MKQVTSFMPTKAIPAIVLLLILFINATAAPDTVDVEIPQIIAKVGDTINLPLKITTDLVNITPEIIAVSLKLTWQSTVLQYINVEKGVIFPPNWIILFNHGQGSAIDSLKINSAGATALINQGEFIVISFTVIGAPGDSTAINFEALLFNEGEPVARSTDGSVMIVSPPVADFSASDTLGIPPFTVSFLNHSSGYITEWLWEFGDYTTSTEPEPIHTYQDTGIYTVRLRVANPFDFDIQEKPDYIKVKLPVPVATSSLAPAVPLSYSLSQNYPNPFNPETIIKYQLPKDTRVSLQIYNLLGQHIRTLVDAQKKAGYHQIKWDGKNATGNQVTSGMYIYAIEAGNFRMKRKMLKLQ